MKSLYLHPTRPIHLALGVLLLVAGACGSEVTTTDQETVSEAMARGDAAFEQLQLGEAVEAYSVAIERDSTRAHPYLMRGQVRWMSQQYGTAVEDLNRALALDSTLAWAYFFRGSSYFSLDSLSQALDDLHVAAVSSEIPDEDRARAHRMRAIVYMAVSDFDKAIDAISLAITLRQDTPLYLFERGLLNDAAGRGPAARDDLERFLVMDTTVNENTQFARMKLDSLRSAN